MRLGDVARVELGPEQEDQGTYFNGVPVVMLSISPQPGANQINIADEFYKRLSIKRIFLQRLGVNPEPFFIFVP